MKATEAQAPLILEDKVALINAEPDQAAESTAASYYIDVPEIQARALTEMVRKQIA